MKSKRIKKEIDIKASREKVWEVLLNEKYTRIWYEEFSEGSHADTDWKEGSKAVFTDHTNSGMVSRVTVHRPYEMLALEYEGVVVDGKEDYEGDIAKDIRGGIESYKLTEKDGITKISIESDMGEEYYESMSQSWEKALNQVKKLAESN